MNSDQHIIFSVWQVLSGAAAFVGLGFLVYFGVRLSVAEARDRIFDPADRVRILALIATAYGMATLLGLVVEPGLRNVIWLAIAALAGIRCGYWRKQKHLIQAQHEPPA